jgi:hypothetical protein
MTPEAFAGPKANAAVQAARVAAKKNSDFTKQFKRLSAAEKARVKSAMKRNAARFGHDADDDGLPDLFEEADESNSCSSDSDHDGTPDDEDSDENEGEFKGSVTSFINGSLVIGSATLVVNDSTEFEGITEEQLEPDVCVEVKSRLINGTLTAVRIKEEDSCD